MFIIFYWAFWFVDKILYPFIIGRTKDNLYLYPLSYLYTDWPLNNGSSSKHSWELISKVKCGEAISISKRKKKAFSKISPPLSPSEEIFSLVWKKKKCWSLRQLSMQTFYLFCSKPSVTARTCINLKQHFSIVNTYKL